MTDLDNLMKRADTDTYYCRHSTRKLEFALTLKNYLEVAKVFGEISLLELIPLKLSSSNKSLMIEVSFRYKDYDRVKEFAKSIIEKGINIRSLI